MTPAEFITHHKWDQLYKARLCGDEWEMHSPFDDDTCSKKRCFYINNNTGMWVCHREGESGGSLKQLEFKLGLIELREPISSHVLIPPQDVRQWQQALRSNKGALTYLKRDRGLSTASITQFKLGYKDECGSRAIVIPIFDTHGACVGYKADLYERKSKNKYKKCKGTKTQLFNLDKINLDEPLYITEGEYDAISLFQYGFTNVGSIPNGAQAINEWADCLEKANQIFICFDNDDKGEEGAEKLAQKVGRARCFRIYCRLKDFNECLQCRMDVADVESNIRQAQPMFNPPITDIHEYTESAYHLLDDPKSAEGLSTGWKGFDGILGGIRFGEVTASSGFTGDGKCYGKGTSILFHNGGTKAVEDVVVGDLLMGDDGTPRRVERLARGREESYIVSPNKGEAFQVNKSHLLVLRNIHKTGYGNREKVVSVANYLTQSRSWKHYHKGIRRGVNFSAKEVTIDPYTLGIWLGDGSSDSGTVTNPDVEIHQKLGITKFVNHTDKNRCASFTLFGVEKYLRAYNLLGNKHIPFIYKTNSRMVRLALLAGLLDSDGYNNHNNYEIATKFPALAEGIKYLARSLGFSAFSKIKIVRGSSYHLISISGNLSDVPIQVDRKKYTGRANKNVAHFGFTLEPVGVQNYYGFLLDGNHKHLLGDFTVGHNSTFAVSMARRLVQLHGIHTLLISPEMMEQKLLLMLASGFHNKLVSTREELDEFIAGYKDHISIARVFDQWTHKQSTGTLLDQVFDILEYSIRNRGTKFIVLDHLRLFINAEQSDNERILIDAFVKRCVHTAISFNVHIWLIVQPKHVDETMLSRCKKCKKAIRKRISRSDFKGSSSIAQDVHNIVLVHRFKDEFCDCLNTVDGSLVEIEIAKNRDLGQEGVISLEFDLGSRANYIEVTL